MSRNPIKQYITFKEKCFKEYTKEIMEEKYQEKIFQELFKTYQEVRYENQKEKVSKTLSLNIRHYLKEKGEELIKNDPEKKLTIQIMLELFKYYENLDGVKKGLEVESVVEKIDSYIADTLILKSEEWKRKLTTTIKENDKRKNKILLQMDTNDFTLLEEEIKVEHVKNIILEEHLTFPSLYSRYAISKAYNTGLIKEDKLFVEYYLISKKLITDIENGDFENHYLLEFDPGLFEKPRKLNQLMNILNTNIAKEMVSFKITTDTLKLKKDEIYKLIQEGYNFTLIANETEKTDKTWEVFRYCFYNKDGKLKQITNY